MSVNSPKGLGWTGGYYKTAFTLGSGASVSNVNFGLITAYTFDTNYMTSWEFDSSFNGWLGLNFGSYNLNSLGYIAGNTYA